MTGGMVALHVTLVEAQLRRLATARVLELPTSAELGANAKAPAFLRIAAVSFRDLPHLHPVQELLPVIRAHSVAIGPVPAEDLAAEQAAVELNALRIPDLVRRGIVAVVLPVEEVRDHLLHLVELALPQAGPGVLVHGLTGSHGLAVPLLPEPAATGVRPRQGARVPR